MGYVAQPFAVDLDLVRKTLGSNDTALYEKILSSRFYENYSSQATDCDFNEVIKELIFTYRKPQPSQPIRGTFGLFRKKPEGLNPKLAHQYGYAMLLICDVLGTFLSHQGDIFYAGKIWEEANAVFEGRLMTIDLDRMWESEKLFDIPEIKGWPVISHYSKEEVSYLLSELKEMTIDESKDGDNSENIEELNELLRAFRDGLQLCKEKDVEWVSFLH